MLRILDYYVAWTCIVVCGEKAEGSAFYPSCLVRQSGLAGYCLNLPNQGSVSYGSEVREDKASGPEPMCVMVRAALPCSCS